MNLVLSKLNSDSKETLLPVALELANIPESIKGFGHVKEKNLATVRLKWDGLLNALKTK
jgi:indolepyruvate ferredoxin oxidoreductase